jgi:transcriptional regulator with XRE-family HTH domain
VEEAASFGVRVKWRRQALHLRQEDLAAQLFCAIGTVRKIELDERRSSKDLAERLAGALAVPTEQQERFVQVARSELALDHRVLPDDSTMGSLLPKTNLPVRCTSFVGRERHCGSAQPAAAGSCRPRDPVGTRWKWQASS